MKMAPEHPASLLAGLTLWFVWLCAIYGGAAAACAVAPPPAEVGPRNWINGALVLLTALLVAGLVVAAWRAARAASRLPRSGADGDRRRFFASAAAMLHGVAAVSTVVVALPLLVLAPCL